MTKIELSLKEVQTVIKCRQSRRNSLSKCNVSKLKNADNDVPYGDENDDQGCLTELKLHQLQKLSKFA